jgi:hypothetical protein
MSKIPGPDSVVWRFVAGQTLTGHYRTDAGFFRRGTKLLGRVQAGRWSYLPGWQRSAVRLTVTGAVPAVVWQYLTHPARTVGVAATVTLLTALWGVWRARRAWQRHEMTRDYVKPIHSVLAPVLGLPPTTRPAEYIRVPATYRTSEKTPAVVRLPDQFNPTPGNRELVAGAALAKLGLNEDNTDVIFRLVGSPVLELKMAPQPPKRVMWADELARMEALPPGQIFVGLGARDKPYVRNFNAGEVVHAGFSVQTGRGKSAAAMAWSAQALHADPEALVTFIDPKQSALPTCLVGVPGYRLANDPDDVLGMWSAVFAFEEEVVRRRRARILNPTLEFSLMYLYLDELSEFMDMSRMMWQNIREDPAEWEWEGKLPKSPPIIQSLASILRMSREYGGRVLVFTQRLDNASTGGIGLRDLLGWRGLAGFRKNQWMMMIGTMPVPKAVKRVGRWIYSDGDQEVWVQNVYGTPEQLRDYAMAGRRAVDTQAGHTPIHAPSPGGLPASVQWDIRGLQAAADYVGMPVGTFRKRRTRNGPIPGEGVQGRSPVWMKADLDNFVTKVEV